MTDLPYLRRYSPVFLLIGSLLLASTLCAQDVGLGGKDSGWMLLQDPSGKYGPGLNKFAGDPSFPVLNPLGWASGNWPTTELWHFDAKSSEFTQATDFLGGYTGELERNNWRRTLLSVVKFNGNAHVLHYDPFKLSGHMSSLLKVDENAAKAEGKVTASNVVFKSDQFFDAPTVSSDGKRIALRFWVLKGNKYVSELRIYSLPEFKLVATSAQAMHSRPVWAGNDSLAVIAWNGGQIPSASTQALAVKATLRRVKTNAATGAGRLLSLELKDGKLVESTLHEATFLGDKTRKTLTCDSQRLAWAESKNAGVQVKVRNLGDDAKPATLAEFIVFQGLAAQAGKILASGMAKTEKGKVVQVVQSMAATPDTPTILVLRAAEQSVYASMLDFGQGVLAFSEPVTNPHASEDNQPLLQHTLRIPALGYDTLRNPRTLVQISGLMSSFAQFDTGKADLASTLLVFDLKIVGKSGEKNGRMVEIFHAGSRDRKGAIRVEDNLGGPKNWIMRSIYDEKGIDKLFTADIRSKDADGKVIVKAKPGDGKAFEELESQLNARRMLTLTNAANDLESGGIQFRGRFTHKDPFSGVTYNIATFMKRGRDIGEGQFERIWISFVTALPTGSSGKWTYPHALCRAEMRFALAGNRRLANTELMFDPTSFGTLERLTLPGKMKVSDKPLLKVPGEFRIYNKGKEGQRVLAVRAKLVTGEIKHPEELSKRGTIKSGYYVSGMGRIFLPSNTRRKFTQAER